MLGTIGLASTIPAPIMPLVKRRREMLVSAVMCLYVMLIFFMA